MSEKEIYENLQESVVNGDMEKCKELAKISIEEKMDAYQTIMEGCAKGMSIVSDRYDKREIFVPEILLSSRAMYAAVEILKPHIDVGELEIKTKVVLGVVAGDIHDIGKNLVKILLDAAGMEIIDLGRDVAIEKFIDAAKENNAKIIGMSALMTTSMIGMKDVVKISRKSLPNTKIIIGGAPISQSYCDSIGADGYSDNAPGAIKLIESLLVGG